MKLGKFETNNIYNLDTYLAIKDIPDNSIDLIVTDPPYEYLKPPQKRKSDAPRKILKAPQGTINRQKKANWAELLPLAYGFDLSLLDEFCRVMKKNQLLHLVLQKTTWKNHNLLGKQKLQY